MEGVGNDVIYSWQDELDETDGQLGEIDSNMEEEKWNKIDEHFQYIYRNLDICCQDMCEGQLSRLKLEEVMEMLSE